MWTHILSLKREDAARLGYDNARAWMNLLRTNRNDIAAAMNIPPNHFRWYAAYHDEGEHPHVHMMAWSTEPGETYLTREGIRKIKSNLTNQIFKQEMRHTYEQKSQSRDELVREARRAIRKLTQEMARSICTEPAIEQKMAQLAGQLETVKGKKSYGYLPKSVKKTVDEVVDRLEEIPAVKACYAQWCALQSEVESYYHDKPRERKKLSQEKEFRQIKNAVIELRRKTKNKIPSAGRVERNPMKRSKYSSFNELPLMLTVQDVADVLGIGLAHAYEVAHRQDFPTITLGSRIIVPRDKFMAWIDEQAAKKTEIF